MRPFLIVSVPLVVCVAPLPKREMPHERARTLMARAARPTSMPAPRSPTGRMPVRPLVVAGVFLGLGLGGFADGILFHQVLKWHHMLTSVSDPAVRGDLDLNLLADGLFHVSTWILTAFGVFLLWRAWHLVDRAGSGRVLGGSILAGAGIFNLVEGIVDHQILGIHHVHPSGALVWDLAYLALGALLVLAGWGLARTALPRVEERPTRGRPT